MPRRLLERCGPDSIREFRAAGRRRFDDGLSLAASGRRTAAVYLWGYTAEMIVKAAYFASVVGLADDDPITWAGELNPAIQTGRGLNINWPRQGAGHNVRAWAELLVISRALTTAAYPAPFAREVQRCGQRIGQLWSETLRYHKNVAYHYEVEQIRTASEWLLVNSDAL